MKTVAIIQARVGSTRLPAKVLQPVEGRPMLGHVVERALRAHLDEVVVATTDSPADDPLVELCAELGVLTVRGSENDVLDRYWKAALAATADVIVRLTSDCPLLDPAVIDLVVSEHRARAAEYTSNGLEPGFPRGLDCEVIERSALEIAWREATQPYERVHVTPFLYQHPTRFRLASVTPLPPGYPDERWTVDTPEDLAFVRAIAARLPPASTSYLDIVRLLELEPQLRAINSTVRQKALEEG